MVQLHNAHIMDCNIPIGVLTSVVIFLHELLQDLKKIPNLFGVCKEL